MLAYNTQMCYVYITIKTNKMKNQETISRKALDGKMFIEIIVADGRGQWYIEDADISDYRTKKETTSLANLCLTNRIEDYEYDNNLR